MTEPIEYRILLNVQSALQTISQGGGYFFTVGASAVSLDPVDTIDIVLGRAAASPFFVVEVGSAGRPTYQPASQILELLPINIIAFANAEQQQDPVAKTKVYERLCADIEKAMTVDISRGGMATDTRIIGRQMQVTTGSVRVVALVQVEIRVYRTYGAPNG